MYKKLVLTALFAIFMIPTMLSPVLAATQDSTGVNLTIQSISPEVYFVEAIAAQDPVDGNTTTVTFEVRIRDNNTYSDISSVNATFFKTGETNRTDASCTFSSQLSATTANYSCSVDMLYYDLDGFWNVSVVSEDADSNTDTNDSISFTYNQLSAMRMSPNNITFGSLSPGQTGVGATDDPIVLNNTGNQNFTQINTTALDLNGVTNSTEYIPAGNFSMNVADSSGGDSLANNTAVTLTSGTLPRGATSTEDIYFYLEEVPTVQAQVYNTAALGVWTIQVS